MIARSPRCETHEQKERIPSEIESSLYLSACPIVCLSAYPFVRLSACPFCVKKSARKSWRFQRSKLPYTCFPNDLIIFGGSIDLDAQYVYQGTLTFRFPVRYVLGSLSTIKICGSTAMIGAIWDNGIRPRQLKHTKNS